MYKLKKTSPINNLKSVQYMLFVGCENNVEHEVVSEMEDHSVQLKLMNPFCKVKRKKPENVSFDMNEKGVISYSDPFCKHCYSHKVTKHGYNVRDLILENGEHYNAKIQRYYCPVCGHYSQTELTGQYENYCNFSNETKKRSVSVREISWYPFRKLKELYHIFRGLIISHETVRNSQIIIDKRKNKQSNEEKEEEKLFYLNSDINPSGFYSYDVQWEPIDKGFYYRHLLFDLVNNAPIAELLAPDESTETTYNFINKTIKPHERKAIVTDLKPGYDTTMKNLGLKHQHCTFHLNLSVNERIRKYLKQKEIELRIKFQKENKNIKQHQLNKLVKKELKEIKEEINIYKELIFELFEQQTYDKAISYVNLLKQEINNFPEVLKKFLIEDFFPEYKKYLWFLKKEFRGKLTRTNNPSETYFHATLPKAEKKRYRTKEGVFNQICNRKNGWMKKLKFQPTN